MAPSNSPPSDFSLFDDGASIGGSDPAFDAASTGVGLSDPGQSGTRRKLLELVNRLLSTGVQREIDLPMIAVIGSQSAGKSSLIESISGITLPRAAGTCTRCPTECRLAFSEKPWACLVVLRFATGKDGEVLGVPLNISFGDAIYKKADVEERLKRAQRAILNPRTDYNTFLNGPDKELAHNELSFSTNCVSLQISGKDLTDLSFCDLPGLIASVGDGGSVSDIDLVKSLVSSYITKPSCLILLTVACETDFENQGAHHLAKLHDPDGKRTIGVLTKPDRISSGEEDRWVRFIRNEAETLENGWFSVKQPNSQALAKGITWAEAREQEKVFFSTTAPWSTPEYQRQLGTQNLTECLSVILSDLIRRRLPELEDEIVYRLKQTRKELNELPSPPSRDARSEIYRLVTSFTRDLSRCIEGSPEANGILQSIRPLQEKFRKAIRATAPNFRPYKRGGGDGRNFVNPGFLSSEENLKTMPDNQSIIHVDEVVAMALLAKTRELPDNIPFVVSKILIQDVTDSWDYPAHTLLDQAVEVLTKFINELISSHFSKYPALHQRAKAIIKEEIRKRQAITLPYIDWLLRSEGSAFTMNEHYYSDYKAKFLSFYRGSIQKGPKGDRTALIQRLEAATQSATDLNAVGKVLTGLTELGLSGNQALDIARLAPPDPNEAALNIMAGVRAYFQVAYKRFVDNVPMAIDQELLRGLDWDRGMEDALLIGLGIQGTGALVGQSCKSLLQEPANVSARREELTKKQERLESAKDEFLTLV